MATNDEKINAKNDLAIRAMQRRDKLEAINDYISFSVCKLSGFGLFGVGLHDMFVPDAIITYLSNPSLVAGTGIALLTGAKTAKVLTKFLTALQT